MVGNLDQKDFKKRLRHIERSTRKSTRAKGANRSGVMDWNEEQRRKERKFKISFTGILKVAFLIWVCAFFLKAFMASQLGPVAYEERIAELRAGTDAERIASYALERGYFMGKWEEFMGKVEANSATEEAPKTEEAPATEGETGSEAPATETSEN